MYMYIDIIYLSVSIYIVYIITEVVFDIQWLDLMTLFYNKAGIILFQELLEGMWHKWRTTYYNESWNKFHSSLC